jgi:hypothetical protein
METMIGLLIIIVGSYLYNMFIRKAKHMQKRSIGQFKINRSVETARPLLAENTKEHEPKYIRHSKQKEREDRPILKAKQARTSFEIKEAAEENSAMTIQEELVKGMILAEVLGPPRAKRKYFS